MAEFRKRSPKCELKCGLAPKGPQKPSVSAKVTIWAMTTTGQAPPDGDQSHSRQPGLRLEKGSACRCPPSAQYHAAVHAIAGRRLPADPRATRSASRRRRQLAGGCVGIRVQWNKPDGFPRTRGFHVVRPDGSTADFSIYCGAFEPSTESKRRWANITQAARFAVRETVQAYKRDYFGGGDFAPCELTGIISHWDDAAVDHAPPWPFRRILNDWMPAQDDGPQIIERQFGWELLPIERANFRIFHDKRARLRVIDKTQNMRLGAHKGNNQHDLP
jgi:hypothetical protein